MSGNYEEITMELYTDNDKVVTRGNSAFTSKMVHRFIHAVELAIILL